MFGRGESIEWRRPNGAVEIRRLNTAKLQHMWALRIRRRLHEKKMKLKTYAKLSGNKYDRLSKVLRGAVLMRLEDLADAQLLLDKIVFEGRKVENPLKPSEDSEFAALLDGV